MEITETVHEPLRREFRITVGVRDLDAKLATRLEGIKDQVNLKGFRPGKVPVAHLRKTYGKSMMGEIVQEAVAEYSQKAVDERSLRPAMSPQIQMVSPFERVIAGSEDLIFTMGIDLMPDFKLAELSSIALMRPVAEVSDENVMDSLKRLAAQQRTYEPKGDDATAVDGDQLLIDFVGKIDGVPFEGGTADNAALVIGSGSFIPGFEDQLKGAKAGEAKTVSVTFPGDYPSANLAGKFAVFDVTVKVNASDKRLKPGLTTTTEVIINHYQDAVFIPLEAVFLTENDETIVYVQKKGNIESRPIVIEESNDRVAVIKAGLQEGEEILLARPESI